MIRTLMTLCCVLMIGLMLTPETAEAKRFGGGSSLGKMFSTPKKAPQSAPKAAQSGTSKSAAGAATKPGMGGMIGGLLAGGLLGAMFFGGAFDGIQMMDVLMMALVAFVLFKLFARSKAVQRPQYAGHPAEVPESDPKQVARQTHAQSPVASGSWGQAPEAVELALPGWFDKKAFIEGAQGHFGQLQQAWSANDLEQIRGYCAGELFAALVEQRKPLGDTVLDNDLVSVVAELVGFNEQQGEAQLSIQFNGWMREGAGAEATEFNEIWHLSRDLSAAGADWFIVGIEQVG